MISRRAHATIAAVHVGLVVAPAIAVGRGALLFSAPAITSVVLLVAFALAESAAQHDRADRSRFGAPGTHVAAVSALGLLGTAWLGVAAPGSSGSIALSAIGAALAVVGIALRVFAIRALGSSFTSETVFVPGQPIVRSGLYRSFDHPSDIGLVLFATGLAAIGGSPWASVVAGFVVLPSVLARVVREERARPRLTTCPVRAA